MILSNWNTVRSAVVEISPSASEYPSAWKLLPDAPEKIYAIGDISLLRRQKFAVVGSRRTPQNAMKLGEKIAKALSSHFTLVTGTADGGDTAAIEGALQGSGRVICLLAGGFSSLPQCNLNLLERVAQKGLLLSPHPFQTQVRTYSYEYRNKLLATLADGLLVLGAGEKSGALITAKYAKKHEKYIFAFPYPPNSASGSGCNRLIKEGAYLTESAGDILEKYGVNEEKKPRELVLTPDERRVYEALRDMLSAHVSELAERAGLPPYKMRGVLSALEVKGAVVNTGGNTYAIV